MGVDMTDFKLSFLGSRRRGSARSTTGPLDEIAEQIRELDEAAHRASRQIDQSARRLRASHKWHPESGDDALAELATSVVERADAIREDCERLAALLERAKRTVDTDPAEPTAADLGVQPEGSARGGPPANGGATDSPGSEGVRLIATQMAIAGSTRPEIQAHLQDRFGIDDATPVLDDIFGGSSAEVS